MKLEVLIEVPDDIVTQVLEGVEEGYCNYWATYYPPLKSIPVATLKEHDTGKIYRFGTGTICRGIKKILSNLVEIDPNIREYILTDNLDADAIDCIVQVGLFGELVYG